MRDSDSDELESLFEQMSSHHLASSVSSTVPAAQAMTTTKISSTAQHETNDDGDSDELETLFEQVSQQNTKETHHQVQDDEDSEELEALFEQMSNHNPKTSTETEAELAISSGDASQSMFDRLGTLARSMHDSMRELGLDKNLNEANTQISNTKERLQYIATITEQAANKVLNITDVAIPEQDKLSAFAKSIQARWENVFEGNMSVNEFKNLAQDSKVFSNAVIQAAEAEKNRLLEIVIAQEFQDLTGQLIKKVLQITQHAERELAQILLDNAPDEVKEKFDLMEGPSMPNQALSQNDVDSLLDSLGF